MTNPEGSQQKAPVPSWAMDGIILDIRASLEALVVKREGMVSENHHCLSKGDIPIYRETHFTKLGDDIRKIAKALRLIGIAELSNLRLGEPPLDFVKHAQGVPP